MADKKATAPKKEAVAKKTSPKKGKPKIVDSPNPRPDWDLNSMFCTLQNNIGTLCAGMSTLSQLSMQSDPYVDFKSIGMLQLALEAQLQALYNLTGRFYDVENHNPVEQIDPVTDRPTGTPKLPGLVFTPPFGGKGGY